MDARPNISAASFPTRLPGWSIRAIARHAVLIFIALILLYSGLVHFGNSYFFLSSIISYDLVSLPVARQMSVTLPILHILLAGFLLSNVLRKSALQVTVALFTAYTIAQISVLVRGIEIDCGCFGIDSDLISIGSVVRVFCLGVITLFLFFYESRCVFPEAVPDQTER